MTGYVLVIRSSRIMVVADSQALESVYNFGRMRRSVDYGNSDKVVF